jgi:hypothetical protein
MRFSEPPTVDRAGKGASGDELDTLLRAFFQSEMPHPWPALPLPRQQEQPRPAVLLTPAAAHPWVPIHSRLALAASVGLLLVGSWFLAAPFHPTNSGDASVPANSALTGSNDKGGIKTREFLEQDKDNPTKFRLELWERR